MRHTREGPGGKCHCGEHLSSLAAQFSTLHIQEASQLRKTRVSVTPLPGRGRETQSHELGWAGVILELWQPTHRPLDT